MEKTNEHNNDDLAIVETLSQEASSSSPARRRRVVALQQFQQNFLTGLTQRDPDTSIARPPVETPAYVEPILGGYGHMVWEHETFNDKPKQIYLGSCETVTRQSHDDLARESIGGIVNCTKTIPCHHRARGMKYCMVAINDVVAADLLTYLPGATAFIRACLTKYNKSVLVHCMAGVSRSSSIVMAYLIRYENMTLEEAYQHVKAKRPQVQPNDGFWAQLTNYEAQCQHKRRQEQERQQQKQPEASSLTILSASSEENTVIVIDKDWAKRSTALYGACRDMELAKDSFLEGCFARVKGFIQQKHKLGQADARMEMLNVALDYIWGRGVLPVEADWLAQLCQILDQEYRSIITKKERASISVSDSTDSSADLIEAILQDPDSEFCSTWAGEIYPHQIECVYTALGTQRTSKEEEL